ncbi:DUF4834 family protein [Nonlabens marinus]|nr:DUF4834 family protein [Nonlabens marinus]
MKLLQAILIIIGVYLAVRLLLKYYGKSILSWAGRKAMQRVQKQFHKQQNTSSDSPFTNGKTQVNTPNSKSTSRQKNPKKTVGEYVDYEEID